MSAKQSGTAHDWTPVDGRIERGKIMYAFLSTLANGLYALNQKLNREYEGTLTLDVCGDYIEISFLIFSGCFADGRCRTGDVTVRCDYINNHENPARVAMSLVDALRDKLEEVG